MPFTQQVKAPMIDFILKQLPYDLSNHAGLALIGKYLKRININSLVDPAFSVRSGIANSDILKCYIGLLCLGKNDFDAIEGQRKDAFFARALGLRAVQSTELKPPVCKPVKDGVCIGCCAEADFAPSHVESASAPSWLPNHG